MVTELKIPLVTACNHTFLAGYNQQKWRLRTKMVAKSDAFDGYETGLQWLRSKLLLFVLAGNGYA